MQYEFHFQNPSAGDTKYLLEEIVSQLSQQEVIEWHGIFAFASRPGIDLVVDDADVRAFLGRGRTRILVGIDAITDRRALRRLQELRIEYPGFEPFAFKNERRSLFHPKISRFVLSDGGIILVVGSGNLTTGGLLDNYEAFSVASIDSGENIDISGWELFERELAGQIMEIDNVVLNMVPERYARPRMERHTGEIEPESEEDAVEEALAPAPEKTQEEEMLVATVPRAGNRWNQIHFNQMVVTSFFRINPRSSIPIYLKRYANGRLILEPPRHLVYSQTNLNIKIELAAGHGLAYPTTGRPILIFRKVGTRIFHYVLVMPGESGHAELDRILAAHPQVGRGLKRVIAPRSTIFAEWPACPI